MNSIAPLLTSNDYSCRTFKKSQSGFSLIEVLVTMLILAFGLLGVAGLLVNGVSNAAASEALSKATQLAADVADRMRANSVVALSAGSQYITSYTGANSVIPTDLTTVANRDKKAWMEALAAQLPDGKGAITIDNPNRKILIEVRWLNCLGTITTAATTACRDNNDSVSETMHRTFRFEIRL